MPPHCDSLDGPVVKAAQRALAARDPELVLPYVPEEAEDEVVSAFERALAVGALGGEARELAERWLFENIVRLHREGEGAGYSGLKPAGLDVGPVIPLAEEALESGDADALVEFLTDELEREVRQRLAHAVALRESAHDVASTREYVGELLGLQVWSNELHRVIHARPHEHAHAHA
jgi:hypothetical protein